MKYEPSFVLHLVEYMIDADRAGFAAASAVSEAEYYKDRGFLFGSIHNLLMHQMVAQKTWLTRLNGTPVLGRLENQTEYPTRQSLAEVWPTVHRGLLELASKESIESLNTIIQTQRSNGDVLTLMRGALLMHIADHGSYHRGQLASMLKLAGVGKPVYAPYLFYAMKQGR